MKFDCCQFSTVEEFVVYVMLTAIMLHGNSMDDIVFLFVRRNHTWNVTTIDDNYMQRVKFLLANAS